MTAPQPTASSHSASLYVGDLASDVTEGLLFEIFNKVGPVVSIRVCRDNVTRRSLGYAYVNFHSVKDAEMAIDTMNNNNIKDRPCRIMWSQRDPSVRKSGVGNIFVKNLHQDIDHKQLQDIFSTFGNILSCKVALDREGKSLGYGFVHYENAEDAQKAIEQKNDSVVMEQKLFVGPFVPRKERQRGNGAEQKFTNVYVKNLPDNCDEAGLRKLFEEYGTIQSCVCNYFNGDKNKAFGFVNFETPEEAKAAVEGLNGKEVTSAEEGAEAKRLFVARAQKKSEREAELRGRVEQWKNERLTKYQGANLYVKNLEDTVDDERLRSEFAAFGNITSAKVMLDDKGNSKGFGFVCFSTPEEATRAVTEMAGRMVGAKPLYVTLAQPAAVRRQQLEAQHQQRQKGGGMRGGPGMNGGPGIYPGAPMFYAQPGNMPQQGFMYPQQMMPRSRGWGAPQNPQYPMSYVVPMGQQQQGGGPRGGNGGPRRGGPGGPKGGNQVRGGGRGGRRDAPAQANGAEAAPAGAADNLQSFSAEQQKMLLGEKLYPLVLEQQPNMAPKITGMLLESHFMDEIIHFLENPDALRVKINEAVTVLDQHAAQAGDAEAPAAGEEGASTGDATPSS